MRFFPFGRRPRPTLVLDPDEARFTRIGGRRHLAALPYPLPKDLEEVNRLDFQHYLLRTGFGGNYLAPLSAPTAILDVGTGSSRWAMEMAAQFPQARVIGLDLAPPAVDERQTLGRGLDQRPPNYAFQIGNVLEGLPYPDGSFDLVHMRSLVSAIPRALWPTVVGELTRVTRAGGWVELAEYGAPREGGPGLMGLWQSWVDLAATRQVDLNIGHTVGEMLRAAGLRPIQRREVAFPLGVWGGRLGVATATDLLAIGRGMRGGMLATGVRDEGAYDALMAQTDAECRAPNGPHGYQPYYLATGQRPA